MKTLILLASLLSTQAFAAFDACKFEDSNDFVTALKRAKAQVVKSKDHQKFTAVELDLIHTTISTEHMYASEQLTSAQTLHIFGDYYEEETTPGSDAGEIIYFILATQKFIVVHYWPGENEYGSIFEVKNGHNVQVANIGDSFIECL